MMIHGLHIQEHERAKKRDLKIMFRTWMMGATTTRAKQKVCYHCGRIWTRIIPWEVAARLNKGCGTLSPLPFLH
jgi:hypothetical protein